MTTKKNHQSRWNDANYRPYLEGIRDAAYDLDLFTVALIENEGQGFSCTEIEQYCRLLEAVGMKATADEVRKGHARGDEEGDLHFTEDSACARCGHSASAHGGGEEDGEYPDLPCDCGECDRYTEEAQEVIS